MYSSDRTQLNNSVASGKEIIEESYHSFSTIIGTQLSRNYENGYIKINLDSSFERFAQYAEADDVSWDSRLLGQFMGDITYGWKKKFKKKILKELKFFYWADVCLCSLTSHGHCCLFDKKNNIDINNTLSSLSQIAVTYADAGIDGISPSDMMDGRTAMIRKSLDENHHQYIPIMSYSSKFASNFYGPFRHAADSTPAFGNRKQYQLDYRNKNEALRASYRCSQEGADLLMVKPGQYSLDLIDPIKKKPD